MKRRAVFTIIGAVVVALLGTALVFRVRAPQGHSGKTEAVRLGVVPTTATSLIYIAEGQGFFDANRLSVRRRDFGTGVATTEALLKGELDVAWLTEFPFVQRALAGERISIIAVVGKFDEQILFGLKDRGIRGAPDLKGKRIGITRNTIAEFYLGRFLELHGLNVRDLTLVDVRPQQSMEAITSGSVDGVIAWEPNTSQLRARLGAGATALHLQSGQPGFGVVVCGNEWIKEHPGIVDRFLRSLARAEEYALRSPAAAKAVVRERLNFDDSFTETIWAENQLSLSIDQSLITAMEDEARWMIKNDLTREKQVPDFLNFIHEGGLKAIRPGAVSIIR